VTGFPFPPELPPVAIRSFFCFQSFSEGTLDGRAGDRFATGGIATGVFLLVAIGLRGIATDGF
jgi:hypothetical protein